MIWGVLEIQPSCLTFPTSFLYTCFGVGLRWMLNFTYSQTTLVGIWLKHIHGNFLWNHKWMGRLSFTFQCIIFGTLIFLGTDLARVTSGTQFIQIFFLRLPQPTHWLRVFEPIGLGENATYTPQVRKDYCFKTGRILLISLNGDHFCLRPWISYLFSPWGECVSG